MKSKIQNIKNNINNKWIHDQSGVVMIISVLLIGIILSIVFSLSLIFIPKLRIAADVKRSAAAAYASESAIEWCLYVSRKGSVARPVMSNGATFINGNTGLAFVEAECLISPVKSIGTFQGVSRAFQASF
ncbi:MAG TPA: hypothetical protein VJH71_00020 [Candidatus Paceibacterota bacterium]